MEVDMNRVLQLLGAGTLGAGSMYLFDPDRGKRRRALLRDKAEHAMKIAADASGKTQRDVRNHLLGVVSEIESVFKTGEVADDVLEARVRARLGRVVAHPGAVQVKAVAGLIILTGKILTKEEHPLLEAVIELPGVKNIENELELHESADDIPALQGGRKSKAARFGPFKTKWSPTTRLVASVAGGALALYGARRRSVLGFAASTAGLGILTRALMNFEPGRFLRKDEDHKAIDIQKTVNVEAPLPHCEEALVKPFGENTSAI
jgi:hypothetical protein